MEEAAEERLFILFRDTTSGKETYGGGYLDLEPDRHQTAAGKWILDFNEAYNPWWCIQRRVHLPLGALRELA